MENVIINQTIEQFTEFINSNKFDVFICSSSFEERCRNVPIIIKNKIQNIIICHYSNNYQKADNYYSELVSYFESPTTLNFAKDNPLQNIDYLSTQLNTYSSNGKHNLNILVDITTFTREMIFIFMYFFKNVPPINNSSVKFIYNPAKEYSFDKSIKSEKWLSRGVQDIRSVLGYSGSFVPNKKLALILLVGFERERAKKIIDTFEPSIVYLGYASENGAISKELQEINLMSFEQLVSILSIEINKFEFSCKNPIETKMVINNIIKSLKKDYNIVIAGLNNKISSFGVALAALENPEIQICYPTANQYNVDYYSISRDEFYLLDVN